MGTTILVGLLSGLLFAVLDMLINANPLARRLNALILPIARQKVNPAVGLAIDVVFGIVMAVLYVQLRPGLAGASGLARGLCYGSLAWFFRVVMAAASQWVMFPVSWRLTAYNLGTGLLEMLALGMLYGLTLSA
jgi:uncharacterized membrane protein YagU involved in acid resistance